MKTVRRALEIAEDFLEKCGVPSARVDSEWLMAITLGCRRAELLLHRGAKLEDRVWQTFFELLEKRAERVPLQYVLGTAPFLDLELEVDKNVLIPRPETEELVEKIFMRLEELPPRSILDLGTGSGACALALAKKFPQAHVEAVDSSIEALSVAKRNAKKYGLDGRISFVHGNWFDGLAGKFSLIISNPPYLTDDEWNSAEMEVRQYEPRQALTSADGGMADLKKIIGAAGKFLEKDGLLALEMGIDHGEILKKFSTAAGFRDVEIERDLSGHRRFLFAK